MIEHKLHKVPQGSVNQCQGVIKNGQCPFEADVKTGFCQLHSGLAKTTENRQNLRNYRLAKWQNRVNDFADSNVIKSLREEIGISRMLLEELILKCQDPTDLLLYSTKISDLLMKTEKLVASCHRLELATGSLLDKPAIIQIAQTIVTIVGNHITDPNILSTISDEIVNTIQETQRIAISAKEEHGVP